MTAPAVSEYAFVALGRPATAGSHRAFVINGKARLLRGDAVSEFHLGWDPEARKFILWERGRRMPVAFIPFADGLSVAETVVHVAAIDAVAHTTDQTP